MANFTAMAKIPYSRKYWRSLNLAVLTPLVDLKLVVWYGIAIRTCTRKKFGSLNAYRQTAKFSGYTVNSTRYSKVILASITVKAEASLTKHDASVVKVSYNYVVVGA